MRIDFGQTKTNRDRSSVRAIRPSGGIFCPCRLLRAYLKKLPGDDTWLLLPNTEAGYLVPYSISHGGAWKAFRKLSSGPTSTPKDERGRVGLRTAMVEADLPLQDRGHQGRLAPGSKMPHRLDLR